MMRKSLYNLLPAALWLFLFPMVAAGAEPPLHRGPSPEIMPEVNARRVEIRRLRFENRAGGAIEGSVDHGATWQRLGTVRVPATAVNREGYTASKWANDASVAATAVNAIHLRVAGNIQENRGIIFSIAPAEQGTSFRAGAAVDKPTSDMLTDIPGGTVIFGGGWAPLVNNPFTVSRDGSALPVTPDYVPRVGDTITILVQRPVPYPHAIIFDNRFGGLIHIQYFGQPDRIIGAVLRPVMGVGRFPGSLFADVGRIRANHCGVIEVSTSPVGKIGAFQIIPSGHAMSPETTYVRTGTQWMVVGPCDVRSPTWEGIPPLFSSFIYPSYSPNDWDGADWLDKVLNRFRVSIRRHGSDRWERMPEISLDPNAPIPKPDESIFEGVTAFRMKFPDVVDE